jgi:hypothetical protein
MSTLSLLATIRKRETVRLEWHVRHKVCYNLVSTQDADVLNAS